MLYNMQWLEAGQAFPPKAEGDRLDSYEKFGLLFDLDRQNLFETIGKRIFANFDEYIHLSPLLAYQRLQTIKLADMVVGSPPSITIAKDPKKSDIIQAKRDDTDFDSKVYQSIIDFSRYGATVIRIFDDDEVEESKGNFCIWDPAEWFPVFKKDGTKRVDVHVLAWREKLGDSEYILHTQVHPACGGSYTIQDYRMDATGTFIASSLVPKVIDTEGAPCLVQVITNLATTTNPYGTSDYRVINSLVIKATERMQQIISILDAHADPSMTGPASLLEATDDGQMVFKTRSFYGISPDEEAPKYLTWDGQLDAAFKGLEMLLNQIYVLSEMGETFLGTSQTAGQAISATAMRYKMVAPLSKARRVSNGYNLPLKKLVSTLLYLDDDSELIDYRDISVVWEDSLPKDPREQAELARLLTGAPQIFSLKHVLMEFYDMASDEADDYIEDIMKDQERFGANREKNDTDINPAEKGSINTPTHTGTNNGSNEDNV